MFITDFEQLNHTLTTIRVIQTKPEKNKAVFQASSVRGSRVFFRASFFRGPCKCSKPEISFSQPRQVTEANAVSILIP